MTQITGASSSTERPLFRYDLQTTAIEEGGDRFIDVIDPEGGESFRFYEVEYAVACGMDGERDVAGIVRWAMLELDLQTTTAEVSAIVAKLSELNYIESAAAAAASPAATSLAAASPAAATSQEPEAPAPISAAAESGIELGNSGKASIETARPARTAEPEDLELGLAGRSGTVEVAQPAASSVEAEFELGVAGNEGAAPVDEVVSAVTEAAAAEAAADEAAAAAMVMTPADISADLAEAVAAEEATPEAVAERSDISDSIAEEAEPVPEVGQEAIALADSAENEAKRAAAKAKEEERAKSRARRKPVIRRSASLVLWLILLGTVAGGAYYYFFYTPYVLEHPADQPLGLNPIPRHRTPAAPQAPAELAAPSTMTITEIPSAEALAVRAGVVEWVSDPGSEVAAGDVILKLRGSSRLQAAVDKETTALETYQLRLETAEAREGAEEDAAAKALIEADIARKQADLDAASAKLAPFVVTAPIGGVVEVLVKARDKVKVGQPIGRVTGAARSLAVFTLSEGNFAAEDEEYIVESIDDSELKATCFVTEVSELEVTLECPSDSGIAADAPVKLVAAPETEE